MLMKQPLDVGLNIHVPLISKRCFFFSFLFDFLGSFWREGEVEVIYFAGSCDRFLPWARS